MAVARSRRGSSWQARALLDGENATFAEGLATRTPFELPQQILWEHLDDFVLVGEDEIRQANRLMIEHTRNLVEPAGAAPLAAALKLRDRLRGKRIALVLSGGNISPAQLQPCSPPETTRDAVSGVPQSRMRWRGLEPPRP